MSASPALSLGIIGPGLADSPDTVYTNPVVVMLFHILPLRLLLAACPFQHPTVSSLAALFLTMAKAENIRPATFLDISDPDLPESSKCGACLLAILMSLRDAAPEILSDVFLDLFAFHLTRSDAASQKIVAFMLLLPVEDANDLLPCLDSFFHLHNAEPEIKPIAIMSNCPRFLFIHLLRHGHDPNIPETNSALIGFPYNMNLSKYAVNTDGPLLYGLGG
jgi:hypothetical protein